MHNPSQYSHICRRLSVWWIPCDSQKGVCQENTYFLKERNYRYFRNFFTCDWKFFLRKIFVGKKLLQIRRNCFQKKYNYFRSCVSNFVLILFLIFIQFLHRAQRDESHEKVSSRILLASLAEEIKQKLFSKLKQNCRADGMARNNFF